jgi:hypothetical protein
MINKKFWEELIACFPLIRHGPHRKQLEGTHIQQGDLKSIITEVNGDTQIESKGDFIGLITLKN